MDAEFPVNARQVRFHRSLSDVQPLPYRPGAEALASQCGDLTLSISERFGTQGGGDGALSWSSAGHGPFFLPTRRLALDITTTTSNPHTVYRGCRSRLST